MTDFLEMYGFLLAFWGILLLIAAILAAVFATSYRSLFNISKPLAWLLGVLTGAGVVGLFWMYLGVPYSDNPILKSLPPTPPYWVYSSAHSTKVVAGLVILFLAGIYYWVNRKILPSRILWTINIGFTLFFGLFLFFYISIMNPCEYQALSNFHYFNAHLKSLCVERGDKSECPQDMGALAGFNHQRWNELNQCSNVTYTFDRASEQFKFRVESAALNIWSDSSTSQGFSFNYN